jgi:hypothetical protein
MKKIMLSLVILLSVSSSFAESSTYNCSLDFDRAKSMVQADGSVENERMFLMAAAVAVDACSDLAQKRNFKGLSKSIASMRSKCDATAKQGMSELYHGTCYLKLADLTRFILNQ